MKNEVLKKFIRQNNELIKNWYDNPETRVEDDVYFKNHINTTKSKKKIRLKTAHFIETVVV